MDTWAVVIAVVSPVCGILFGYLSYLKNIKNDSHRDGENDATLRSDTEYIKHRIDDVLLEQKEINRNMHEISERLTRVEESAKQAHKRIDKIEGER